MKFSVSFLLLLFSILLILPLVSAYSWNYGGGFSYNFSDLLNNELVIFALLFVIFFAMFFYTLGKAMKDNKGAAAVISAAISLFAAFALSQRTIFYGYVGETIGNWALVLFVIVGVVLLVRVITGLIGGIGLFLSLGGIWYLLSKIDPYDIFPSQYFSYDFYSWYEFFAGTTFLIILIVAVVITFIAAYSGNSSTNKRIKRWLWHSEKNREITIPLE